MSEFAKYCRFVINGQRVFPAYNLFGECVWDRPIAQPYCNVGKHCESLADCGEGYCSSTNTCSAAKPTTPNGPVVPTLFQLPK